MFSYTDPGKTLKPAKALANYRQLLHEEYRSQSKLAGSAFTLLEAFEEIPDARKKTAAVDWIAFPRTAQASNEEIDTDRFRFQDEYVEWRVEKTPSGKVKQITFTTDFLEYYRALAMVGMAELAAAIRAVIPNANPRAAELFGPNFQPYDAQPVARGNKFAAFAPQNPWNNGKKGILCLTQQFNTLGALFNLAGRAAVPNSAIPAAGVCDTLGGFCGSERNSDPSIATAIQTIALARRGISLVDPVGIEIVRLGGIWRIGSTALDINNPAGNQQVWTVSRRGRRAVLKVVPNLTLDDEPVTSGAQVASVLKVQAVVVSASEADMPEWSRIGQENSQRLSQVAAAGGEPT
jgi:hypothetical protein